MSAIEQTPFTVPAAPPDRRNAPRYRVGGTIAAHLGRRDAVLIDISATGARVRHSYSVLRGSTVRLAFEHGAHRFTANADVLAVRVFALGDGNGGATVYESRLRFRNLDDEHARVLQDILEEVDDANVRQWVSNLRGWSEEHAGTMTPKVRISFVRCRLIRDRWTTKWTHDALQPEDGFVLPATFDALELEELCRTYRACDDEGRQLIRRIAAEVVTASER